MAHGIGMRQMKRKGLLDLVKGAELGVAPIRAVEKRRGHRMSLIVAVPRPSRCSLGRRCTFAESRVRVGTTELGVPERAESYSSSF